MFVPSTNALQTVTPSTLIMPVTPSLAARSNFPTFPLIVMGADTGLTQRRTGQSSGPLARFVQQRFVFTPCGRAPVSQTATCKSFESTQAGVAYNVLLNVGIGRKSPTL